jgi:uncharacterized membrane protein
VALAQATIDVRADIATVYDEWTRFESYPRFMDTVRSVTRLDDSHLRLVGVVAGRIVEWEAEITERVPGRRISWLSVTGPPAGGTVTFATLAGGWTRITLRLEYRPHDLAEPPGQALGTMQHRVSQDLQNFKDVVEDRGEAADERRGRIAS